MAKMETFSMEKMEKPLSNSPFYAIAPPPPLKLKVKHMLFKVIYTRYYVQRGENIVNR